MVSIRLHQPHKHIQQYDFNVYLTTDLACGTVYREVNIQCEATACDPVPDVVYQVVRQQHHIHPFASVLNPPGVHNNPPRPAYGRTRTDL